MIHLSQGFYLGLVSLCGMSSLDCGSYLYSGSVNLSTQSGSRCENYCTDFNVNVCVCVCVCVCRGGGGFVMGKRVQFVKGRAPQ